MFRQPFIWNFINNLLILLKFRIKFYNISHPELGTLELDTFNLNTQCGQFRFMLNLLFFLLFVQGVPINIGIERRFESRLWFLIFNEWQRNKNEAERLKSISKSGLHKYLSCILNIDNGIKYKDNFDLLNNMKFVQILQYLHQFGHYKK